ncbi:MAG: response regulator transcription factor [Ardenticatenaceae bacterium]|nr:response regulator transcription factor [Ardenticatenaceae bacterium]
MNDPTAEATTVVLVDDHKIVRQGVKGYLDMLPDIDVVGEAESGREAVDLASSLAPDVMLMDLVMPGMDGVESTRAVKQVSPRTQIIVLTSYHQDEHIFPAIRAGALSYILKDVDPADLADAVRLAAHGEAVLHPRVAARLVEEVHGARHATINPFTELSDRELEVLKWIADGLSNGQIAEKLVISERTVKNHVSNILGKLHVGDRTQAAVLAWKEGVVRRKK